MHFCFSSDHRKRNRQIGDKKNKIIICVWIMLLYCLRLSVEAMEVSEIR